MEIILIKQRDGFALIENKAWKKHLNMIRMHLLQEEPIEEVEVLMADYEEMFEIIHPTSQEVSFYKQNFNLEINLDKQINSYFGTLMHF